MIFYYSACGNSKYIAKSIASAIGDKLSFIPDLIDSKQYSFDLDGESTLGFVFPVYAWDVPVFVADFIREMKLTNIPSYIWFACTCGDNIGLTCDRFSKILAHKGMKLNAAFTFQMPETYLCFPGFNLDTPDGAMAKIDAVRVKLPSVIASINDRKQVRDLIPGGWPGFKTAVIGPLFNLTMTDKGFHCNEECIGCGLCEKVCHFHNITMQDDGSGRKPNWGGHCTQCMACYHYCPKNAIHFSGITKGKGQYHFPDEILKAVK
ncbi:MAG: EFR1 family ferrodoxin [Candidatus Cryptobacteroides sp.]